MPPTNYKKIGENIMSKKEIKTEWKQYMVDENKEYSFLEFFEKFKEAVGFLKEKGIRVTKEILSSDNYEKEYRLTDDEKLYYTKRFMNRGYSESDSETIIKVMDALYHMLDITKEQTEKFTEYIAENQMTLSDAISEKYGLSLDEINEYMEVVLESYLKYCIKKSLQYGKELIDILAEVFPEE